MDQRWDKVRAVAGPAVVVLVVVALWGLGLLPATTCGTAAADMAMPRFLVEVASHPGQPNVVVHEESRTVEIDARFSALSRSYTNGTGTAAVRLHISRVDTSTADAVAVASWTGGNWTLAKWAKPDGRSFENVTSVLVEGGSSARLDLTITFSTARANEKASIGVAYTQVLVDSFTVSCNRWTVATDINIG